MKHQSIEYGWAADNSYCDYARWWDYSFGVGIIKYLVKNYQRKDFAHIVYQILRIANLGGRMTNKPKKVCDFGGDAEHCEDCAYYPDYKYDEVTGECRINWAEAQRSVFEGRLTNSEDR